MRGAVVAVLIMAMVTGCRLAERDGGADHELPPLTVVGVSSESVRTATVTTVVSPDIAFRGLVEPDPRHTIAVVAPATGALVSVQPERHVGRDDPVLELRRGDDARVMRLAAAVDGVWRPRRLPQQFVWRGDTLGVVMQHGYWLAVGSVADYAAAVIHVGDSATVVLGNDRRGALPGRVEEVLRAETIRRYSTEVAVEFRAGDDLLRERATRSVSVVLHPRDAADSVLTVPGAAIVHFPNRSAVFVPAGDARFRVHWVLEGPAVGNAVVVRQGVARGWRVVVAGLPPLVAAARESLALRGDPR